MNLKEQIDKYLLAGQEAPIGLLEEYYDIHNKQYEPSMNVGLMYKVISGKKYSQTIPFDPRRCGHDEVEHDREDIISEPHEQGE